MENKETLDAVLILWDDEGWTHAKLARAFRTSEKNIIKMITQAKIMRDSRYKI